MRPPARRPVQGDVVRARLEALALELRGRAPDDAANGEEQVPVPPAAPAPPTAVGGPLLRRAWEFGRAHLAVVGVVGLVGLLGSVWALSQARTVPVAVAAPTAVPATAVPTATPSPEPEPLRVHVLGSVASPGVVRLPPGSRVEDAVAAAGGLTPGARPGELNLAAPVADGAQVFVGDARDPGGEVRAGEAPGGAGPGGAAASGERLDLNRATLEQLDALPGVGPVTARAILAWRTEHQRFSRVEELQEVEGIGAKTLERLAPLVRV